MPLPVRRQGVVDLGRPGATGGLQRGTALGADRRADGGHRRDYRGSLGPRRREAGQQVALVGGEADAPLLQTHHRQGLVRLDQEQVEQLLVVLHRHLAQKPVLAGDHGGREDRALAQHLGDQALHPPDVGGTLLVRRHRWREPVAVEHADPVGVRRGRHVGGGLQDHVESETLPGREHEPRQAGDRDGDDGVHEAPDRRVLERRRVGHGDDQVQVAARVGDTPADRAGQPDRPHPRVALQVVDDARQEVDVARLQWSHRLSHQPREPHPLEEVAKAQARRRERRTRVTRQSPGRRSM